MMGSYGATVTVADPIAISVPEPSTVILAALAIGVLLALGSRQ